MIEKILSIKKNNFKWIGKDGMFRAYDKRILVWLKKFFVEDRMRLGFLWKALAWIQMVS